MYWKFGKEFLIIIGSVLYAAGFIWGWRLWMEHFDENHPMAHSSDYRMTDGWLIAFCAGLIWPLVWSSSKLYLRYRGWRECRKEGFSTGGRA